MVKSSPTQPADRGSHLVLILIIGAALIIIGLLIWAFFGNPRVAQRIGLDDRLVTWEFDGENWSPQGTPPACEEPLIVRSPVDIDKVNSVLLPGQVRGTDFKPHGGLATDMQSNNDMVVSTVRDGYIYRGSRYISFGEVQHMFDFIDPCGVMFRLDHLGTLTDEFQKYADRMPEPQLDDSRTTNFDDHPWIPRGTVIATTIGIKSDVNTFFDFGLYDLRKRNEASTTELYKTDELRISDKEQSFYALCWFDNLPEPDKTKVLTYPERDGSRTGKSDYCTDWR
jgi:hypothetical protein